MNLKGFLIRVKDGEMLLEKNAQHITDFKKKTAFWILFTINLR